NANDEADRACKIAVRFFAPGTVSIPNGLMITQAPPSGQNFGFAIRKCDSSEGGCPQMTKTDVVIDASGYTQENGDCPIKVFQGAWMDFINFKLIVKNKNKAFCTAKCLNDTCTQIGGGDAIPLEDTNDNHAWIHNVTICEVDDPNCAAAPVCENDDDCD